MIETLFATSLTIEQALTTLVSGFGIGLLSGVLGIGGGTLLVPLFRIGFALSALQATATSLCAIVPISLAGCVTHIKQKTCIPALGLAAGFGGACISPLGVKIAQSSPSWLIMLVAACIIGYSAISMLKGALRKPSNGSLQQKQDNFVDEEIIVTKRMLIKAALAGTIAGFLAGFVGVGGGFIMVPLFVSWVGVGVHRASGTSLLAIPILAIPGIIQHVITGNALFGVALFVAITAIPGAIIGAKCMKRIPERGLRIFFGIVLLILSGVLAVIEFVS